jgi:NADH:ubiquinone oxidoreductase subunit F (NADH-binding)
MKTEKPTKTPTDSEQSEDSRDPSCSVPLDVLEGLVESAKSYAIEIEGRHGYSRVREEVIAEAERAEKILAEAENKY